MQENRWQKIEELFNRAAVLPERERQRFVEDACKEDEEICREVLLLIDSDSREDSFLNEPVFNLGAEILENDFLELLKKEDFADYRLKKLLGRGGMGAVFLAEDTRLSRLVAVKVLPASVAEKVDAVSRFQKEARAASGVAHQNIAHIYEFSQADGRYFLAMEYVRGRTLRELIKEKLIDENRAIDFALQIASALQAAHKAGIIHRDIKPENVIVTEDNLVKVLDFGLAKLTDSAKEFNNNESLDTIPGMIIGTTAYMSPEQIRGQHLDQRTDVWSLGVTLFEILAGARPFQGETTSDLQAAILRDEIPALSVNIKLQKNFNALCRKCLEKDRLKRFQTVSDFIIEAKVIKQKLSAEQLLRESWKPRDYVLKAALPLVLIVAAVLGVSSFAEKFSFWQTNRAKFQTTQIARPIESLAVAPFENLSSDTQINFLSEGLAEDLSRSLGSLNQFTVISYSSSRKIKPEENAETIKNRLVVGSLLRGKIESENENLSVKIELIDLETGAILWADKLSASSSDSLKLRNALVSVIAGEVQNLSGGEKRLVLTDYGTRSNEAYLKYLEGKYAPDRATEDGTRRAAESFKKAIAFDPNYALAYVALADTYNLLGTWFGVEPDFYQPLAKKTIERAVTIDADLSEAHTTLAKIKMDFEHDFSGTENEFKHAIELNPNNELAHHWYGEVYLSAMGRFDESLLELEISHRLNPLSSSILTGLAHSYIGKKDYERAIELCEEAARLNPSDDSVYSYKSMALMKLGRFDEAIETIKKDSLGEESAELGVYYGLSGRIPEARQILIRMQKNKDTSPYSFAVIYASIGEKDRAFELLEKQLKTNSVDLLSIRVDPLLDTLRDDDRFKKLEAKLHLPD
jgi:serine/threonine protein kinase/Tfp pilus assembly protein PilF